jgi:glycosyltransferase involved in cell wall biosynthesis
MLNLKPETLNKILIITYYWPPSGGSGVQRWLKFVKYLPASGWKPYVVAPENPSFTIRDETLLNDVPPEAKIVRLPIWEPYNAFFKLSRLFGKRNVRQSDFVSTGKKSAFHKASSWVRGNLFIPDARVFWVNPSVRFLKKYIAEHQIGHIVTTGPPHSVHLIGLKLKAHNPMLKWVADFRDPWSEWDLLDTLSLSLRARKKHRALEREVLHAANRVITIAPFHVQRFEELGGRNVDLITNGFDEDDFKEIVHARTDKFTIRHVGIVDELRDPRPVMVALKQITESNSEFAKEVRLEFIGNVNSYFKSFVTNDPVLSQFTKFIDTIPHAQLLKLYGETDVQLLVLAFTAIAPGNLPGKMFEYLASGNPILAIGPTHGDAADVLKQTQSGEIFEHADIEGIRKNIVLGYRKWKEGVPPAPRDVKPYTRQHLTEQLVRILNSL